MRLRSELRFKIVLQLCLVFGCGLLLQGYLNSHLLYSSFLQVLQQEQFDRVTTSAEAIDAKLKATQSALVAVSRVVPLAQLHDAESLQRWLDDRRGLASTFDNGLFLFAKNGDLLVESPFRPDRRGRSFSFRPYYQETVRSGQPYISDPYVSTQQHRHPVIMMTAPVFDPQGELIAIFSGSLDLLGENFLGGLSRQKIGKKGYFYLAGRDRRIIVHPDQSRILKQDVTPGANPLFDRAMAGFEGCEETVNSRKLATLTAFKQLQSKDWVLGSNYPMDEIVAPLQTSRQQLWLAAASIFVLMFLFSMLSFRRVFVPLLRLTRHLEQLPEKTGDERIFPCACQGEIATLADTFNRMLLETDRARQSLAYAQQMAHLGSWSWDMASNTLVWSDEVFRIFGDRPKAYVPTFEFFLSRVHPEDRARVEQALAHSLENQKPYTIEHRVVQPGGSLRQVKEQGELLYGSQGRPTGIVGTIQDVTEIMELQQRLQELATTDELTGAVNRRQLFVRAEQLVHWSLRHKSPFSLLFYDLDHFKQVNDAHGHPAGDEVLQLVTARIQGLLRTTDTLARYGGEEFCVLAPEANEQSAEILAERIRSSVEQMTIRLKNGKSLQLTLSIGIATYRLEDTLDSLIERADQGVYQAKKLGRNRTHRC